MKWFIPGLLLLVLSAALRAQSVTPSVRQFRVIGFADAITGLRYQAPIGGASIPVRVLSGNFSGPYVLGGAGPLEFFRENADGSRQPMAQVVWPAGIRRGLVFLAASPVGSPLPLSAIVLDDSAEAAGLRTIRFINLSNRPAAVRFAGQPPRVLNSSAQWTVSYDPSDHRALTEIATGQGGDWTVVMSRHLPLPDKRRIWVVMSPILDAEGKDDPANLDLRIITDRLPYNPVSVIH